MEGAQLVKYTRSISCFINRQIELKFSQLIWSRPYLN